LKYACKFYQGCSMLDIADEIIIKYDKKDREILKFVQKWKPEQRIILNITELEDIEKNLELFTTIAKLHNIAFLCSKEQDFHLLEEECLSYFFIEKCGTLDELIGQIRMKVSDVYITNELGFYLPDISRICKDKHINVRVIPNVAQSSSDTISSDFTKFFIRPDDLYLYEDYIDVIEFLTDRLEIQPTLYEIYKDGRWDGDLCQIIYNFNEDIPNNSIIPIFGEIRLNCKKRCCFNKCDVCKYMESIARELNKKDIHFEKE